MASHTLTLYMDSSSTYNLEGVPLSIDLVPESSFVREEAWLITEAPLDIMAPSSYAMSGGSSLKTMAHTKAPQGGTKKKTAPTRPTTSVISLKRKAPDIRGPSKRSLVTPSGNSISRASSSLSSTRPSPSYTMVGMCKPNRGYRKELMQKPAKKSVSKPTLSGKESESSGTS